MATYTAAVETAWDRERAFAYLADFARSPTGTRGRPLEAPDRRSAERRRPLRGRLLLPRPRDPTHLRDDRDRSTAARPAAGGDVDDDFARRDDLRPPSRRRHDRHLRRRPHDEGVARLAELPMRLALRRLGDNARDGLRNRLAEAPPLAATVPRRRGIAPQVMRAPGRIGDRRRRDLGAAGGRRAAPRPATRSPSSRPPATPVATPTRSRSQSRRRTAGRRHRLHRLQRPQLPELRGHARRARDLQPAGEHELRSLRRARPLRVGGARRARDLRPPPPPRRSPVHPDALRSRPLQPRGPRAARPSTAAVRRSGTSSSDGRYSEYFVERLIVPQVSAVWSADPDQMWSFPASFLANFFENHGVLQIRNRPSLADDPGRLPPLRRGADGAVRRPDPPAHAGRADQPHGRRRRGDDPPRAAAPSTSTRSSSPATPIRRSPCSPIRAAPSASCSPPSRTSPTRRCSTPTPA